MKKFWVSLACMAVFPLLAGCKTVKAPLPAGAVNSLDAQINAILQAGHAAVVQYDKDVCLGVAEPCTPTFTPAAGYKGVMENLTNSLNVADPLYQQYHATLLTNPNAPEPAQLVSAAASVQGSLNQIPGVK